MTLVSTIRAELDDKPFPMRVFHSLQDISKKRGRWAGWLTGSSITAATVYALAISYFTMEGSVRALIDLGEGHGDKWVGLRPLGDAGGWISLSIFSILGLENFVVKVVREGEYVRLKSICKRWISDQQAAFLEDPGLSKNLYKNVAELLDSYSSQCFFSISHAFNRLNALKILSKQEICPGESDYQRDADIKNELQEIHLNMDNVTYFQNIREGHRQLADAFYTKRLGVIIRGIALPIILLITTIFSLVGEMGLGKELYIDRQELTDVGHFGEWPLNAAESFMMALFLHLWCVINEGSFVNIREIYGRQLQTLKERPEAHNRLVKIANQELTTASPGCHYYKLPMEYKFTKL